MDDSFHVSQLREDDVRWALHDQLVSFLNSHEGRTADAMRLKIAVDEADYAEDSNQSPRPDFPPPQPTVIP